VSNRWITCLLVGDNGWKRPLIPHVVAGPRTGKERRRKASPEDGSAPH